MAVGRGDVRVRRHPTLVVLLIGDWVVPVTGPPIAGGAVLVEGERIAEVGPAAELRARYVGEQVREFAGCALLPGLINAHTHLDYSAFYGFPQTSGFMRWIIRLTRERMRLDASDLAASALWGAYECLRHGVTSIADTSYGGSTVARAALAVGIRARVYLEVFGLDDDRLPVTMERLEAALETAQAESREASTEDVDITQGRGQVEWGVSPHAPYTVSQALYGQVARFARGRGLRMATHVAESKTEVRLLGKHTAPASLFYRIMSKAAGGRWRLPTIHPLQYVAESGALGADMLAVHGVQLEQGDLRVLADSGTPVAHCPRSNLRLSCGTAPVAEMRAAGIVVGLGTDSLASNESLDILAEMKTALTASASRARKTGGPKLHASEVLRMATLDGAEALGWKDSIGSLQVGKLADMVAIRLPDGQVQDGSVDGLAWAIMEGEVRLTLVGGQIMYEGRGTPDAVKAGMAEVRAKLRLTD